MLLVCVSDKTNEFHAERHVFLLFAVEIPT